MKKLSFTSLAMAVAIIFTITSCSKNADKSLSENKPDVLTDEMMSERGTNPDETSVANGGITNEAGRNNGHYLYTESNAAGTNAILVYKVKNDGSLQHKATVSSGGAGTGSPLGSQGALALDKENEWLYAVNAAGNSVSSFSVHNDGSITLAHTEYTHGTTPVSVTVHGNLLYVLNRGSDNIRGFHIGSGGTMTYIPGSDKALSSTSVDAPQISFTPNGDFVVVTEKATNVIGTFRVKNDGSVHAGVFSNSVGQTPFGFAYARDNFMIVSNASAGAAGAGTATSYTTGNNGVVHDVNGARPNYQAAPCWFAVTEFGRFAFTTNTASNNISSYYVSPFGGLYLVQSEAAASDMGPLDIAVAANNYHVYVVNAGSHTITEFHRKFLGGLEFIGRETGLPAGTTGLAIY